MPLPLVTPTPLFATEGYKGKGMMFIKARYVVLFCELPKTQFLADQSF